MKKYFITGVAICIGFVSFAQKAVDFKLNPEIGKPIHIDMLVKTDVDGPQSVIMDMTMNMLMTPTEKQDENFKIESVTKTIKVNVDAGMMTMSYDSEKEAEDEMSKMLASQFSKIIDQTITIILTPKGKPVDVVLPEGLAQGMDKAAFSNISTPLPDAPVAVGATWENTAEMGNNPLISKTETTSTFKAENADGYVIDVIGKMLDDSANEVGSISGTYTLDKKTLFTKSGQIKTAIEAQGAKIVSDVTITAK
ncbi:DUF6263 family protein [Sphingobacterium oryzagri]|uniref:DUF6263 family protein n=1 Tax=Sphingobacterium oryzagri TaxID=3025669 RepID=A0ABY7WH27_9SPHI|nr:DUF6263 family protein [Sphingobacterium sp. KACC 22765]WDF68795.1 DUF6263 family protein [Sphingobacterium sp. KACC 22765]